MAIITDKQKTSQDKSKQLPQVLALCSASIAAFASGNLFSFASPAIPKLTTTEDYNFTIEQASYLTVIPPLAMIVSSPIFCLLIDKIGRKRTLLLSGLFHIASWICVACTKNIAVFYVSRIFSGLSDANVFSALPTYIAEVTTPRVRSLYGNVLVLFMFCGQFSVNVVGFYLSIPNTAFVLITFPVLFLITFIFMPETPYYLIMIGDDRSAEKSLQRLRGMDDVQKEVTQLKFDVERQLSERGHFKDLFLIPSNRKALAIANLARAFQQLGGMSSLVTYTQYIFMKTGGVISGGHAAMIFSGILAFVNVFINILTDKFGRKNSMIISCAGSGLALFSMSTYFYLQTNTAVDLSKITWFPVFASVLYVLISSLGLGIVPTVMMGEIFSTSIRKHATMVTNMIFGVFLCTVTKFFQFLMTSFGLWVPFLFFSLCCAVGSVLSYFVIPETKGRTLEQIQQDLKGNKQGIET